MSDWAYALSQGVAAGANAGAGIMDAQIRDNMSAQAEQRAADIKLDTASRLMAIEQAMKDRAAERFSKVVQAKAGEEIPVEPDPVSKTGITHDSGAVALGDRTYDGETAPATGLQGSPDQMKKWIAQAQATLANPAATDQQKQDAQGLIDQIGKQADAQGTLNAKDSEGKTRKRTIDEASQAALDETLQTDAPAFAAGTGMLSAGNKQEIAERTLKMREAQIAERLQASSDRTTMMGEIAKIRLEAAQNAGADGGKLPSDAKMIEYLMGHGMDHKTAVDRVMGTGAGATKDPVAMATSLASSMISGGMVRVTKDDPPGTTVASKAMGMAMDQIGAAEGRFRNQGLTLQPASWKGANEVPNPVSNDPLGLFKK